MVDIRNLKNEEKLFLLEELLKSIDDIKPSWHKKILEERKDFKNQKLYSIEEIRGNYSYSNFRFKTKS